MKRVENFLLIFLWRLYLCNFGALYRERSLAESCEKERQAVELLEAGQQKLKGFQLTTFLFVFSTWAV
jgi:hypothetical protein